MTYYEHDGPRDQTLATPLAWIAATEVALGAPFDLDACAQHETAKAPRYYTKETDGLASDWFGLVWVNPPFDSIGSWVLKAIDEIQAGRARAVVFVVPANRSDQSWAQCLRRLERDGKAWSACPACRVRYDNGASSAPFPSMFWAIGDPALASRIRRLEGMPQIGSLGFHKRRGRAWVRTAAKKAAK